MRENKMFHAIRYYRSADYFKKHRFIIFDTLYDNYVWEVFSFYRARTDFNYIKVFFRDDDDFFNLARQMKNMSMYDTGVTVTKEDRILTLSTCTNEDPDTRFVLNARLINTIEENEE